MPEIKIPIYKKLYLTNINSANTTLYEPSNGYSSDYTMIVGNKATGIAYYPLLKINRSDLPLAAHILSATLRLAESDTSNRGNNDLTVKISRITGTWGASTKWNTAPAYDSAVHCDYEFNTTNRPNSSNFWHRIDVTNVIQDCIDLGCTGLIFWFDLPGTNSTNKYLYNQNNSNSDYQPLLIIAYDPLPSLTVPSLDNIGIVSSANKTFSWSDSIDISGIVNLSDMYYEMQISTDNGANFGEVQTTEVGISEYTIDLKSYLELADKQYYYNSQVKLRVRACVVYEGATYYSSYVTSDAFAVDYRIAPTAPQLSIDVSEPYEKQNVVFTVGRPGSYNSCYISEDDSELTENELNYYIEIYGKTINLSVKAAVSEETAEISYTMGEFTSGKADLLTSIRCYCVDSKGQTSPFSNWEPLTVKRFRAPIVNVGAITRTAITAAVPITIQDTGYGASQSGPQINKIQYNIGNEWIDAMLGAWNVLTNSFTTFRPVNNTWAYVSANSVSVPSGALSIYSSGYSVKFTQGGDIKNFSISNVTDTLLTLTGDTVENSTISSISYSPLIAGNRYSIAVRAVNEAPLSSGLSNITGTSFATTILEYTPVFAVLNDGAYVKGVYVGSDYSKSPAAGTIYDGTNYALFGPGSSSDNFVPRYDGTTGRKIQASLMSISDNGSPNIPSGQAYKVNGVSLIDIIYPVGSIYISVSSISPATLFGGTWSSFGSGKVLVGYNGNDTDFNAVKKTGGAKTHTLTAEEIPPHRFNLKIASSNNTGSHTTQQVAIGREGSTIYTNENAIVDNCLGREHSIMNPYIVVYMWERTA